MLRKIRTTLAIIVLALVTLLFLDVSGALHAWLGWLAKIQFLPAVLALNVGVIVALVALTNLLLRHLSAWHLPGCHLMDSFQTEEESFQFFS